MWHCHHPLLTFICFSPSCCYIWLISASKFPVVLNGCMSLSWPVHGIPPVMAGIEFSSAVCMSKSFWVGLLASLYIMSSVILCFPPWLPTYLWDYPTCQKSQHKDSQWSLKSLSIFFIWLDSYHNCFLIHKEYTKTFWLVPNRHTLITDWGGCSFATPGLRKRLYKYHTHISPG